MRGLGSVFLVSLCLGGAAFAADRQPVGDPWADGGEEAERPAAKPVVARATKSSRKTQGSASANRHKKVAGNVVPDSQLRSTPAPRPSGALNLYAVSSDEALKVNIYNEDGSYDIDAVQAASRILRCKRTDTVKDIEPRLLAILSQVYDHFGHKRIEIVSGYRNQRRTTSYHFQGAASDIRIAGVAPKKLRAFVETLDEGGMGIGLYPRSGFVHIDVRPPPSYRWIDYSRSDSNAAEKRPPRGWKRKKLQS